MTNRSVPPGRHPNWCRCPGCRADIARFESAQWNRILVIGAVLAVIGGAIWLAKVMARAWHEWAVLALVPVAAVLVYAVLRVTREPAPVPVLPGPGAPAGIAGGPGAPQPPLCLHLNAVKVENLHDPEEPPWAYWCTECETQLDAEFGNAARSCCGTAPGTPHGYNCPL